MKGGLWDDWSEAEWKYRYTSKIVKDIVGSEAVQAGYALVDDSIHGECFSWACLSVGEACNFGSLEGGIDKGADCLFVDLSCKSLTY